MQSGDYRAVEGLAMAGAAAVSLVRIESNLLY